MQSNRRGFTLVELIVVVVILSVLSTIGFISYANYISSVRDTKRVGDLVVIHDGLQTAVTNGDLPLPDNYVTINAGGTLVGYQGYAGSGTLTIAGVQNGGMDPKNGSYYGYYLYKDRKSVQLMAWLEDSPDKLKSNSYEIPSVVPTTYASTPDYVNRYPKVHGRQLGILTDSLNIPVQDTVVGTLDIATTPNTYVSYYDDTTKVTGTGGSLITSLPNASCKRIRDTGNSTGDGVYRIDPQGNGGFDVWCDMTTDGGGWTLVGRSVTGGSGTFGFKSGLGDIYNDNSPYSLDATYISFSEILFGDYSSAKTWGNYIYKKSVPVNFIATYLSSYYYVSTTTTVKGSCTGNPSMFNYTGITSYSTYFFLRDCTPAAGYGLLPNGFATAYNNCVQGGNLNGLQGMMMVR